MDEYKAPMINKTWSLVPYSTGMNVDENKWVFRVKCKLDGTIQRYKASIGCYKGLDIQQIDINNAFLNGDLQKVALMLLKSIKKFALKTLGSLNYFLGFEVHRGSSVLYLTQTKYIIDLLKKTGMNGAKSISTHKLFGNKLFLSLGDPFEDPSLYHSTIGALQYLTMTRPDISFAVNKLSCPILWCDNIGAGSLPSSPVFHTRTKHIQIDVHFIHEKVLAKELDVRYISTEDQIVDVLTKPLSEARVEQLLNKLTVALSPFSLRGVINGVDEGEEEEEKEDEKKRDCEEASGGAASIEAQCSRTVAHQQQCFLCL
ncbi:Retrovirus-related Pol polyprotein from transposon RE1 [Vitis vinifera]|uniref:Retrovirus-related Pol polyprotein from transposon RE1 n=1 Tax=Vitis vinifera TaxID=29760 RepID=A0A438ISH7_VITVI|nr:Retrovirus-related Pol polyprotein from transposon RE1 [Vitis vinifera]